MHIRYKLRQDTIGSVRSTILSSTLSISNLTMTCACCGKTCASYSGVYKHSKKCLGIHPNEKMMVGSCLKTAPTPDSNSMNGTAGIVLATTNNTESRNELLDIGTQHNQINNAMTESMGQEEHHQNNTLDTPMPMNKEGCIKKKAQRRETGRCENLRQTRSRAKKGNK